MRKNLPFARGARRGVTYRPREQADFELIARFLGGEASRDEIDELDRWIDDNPDRGLLVMRLSELWDLGYTTAGGSTTDEMWRLLVRAAGIGRGGGAEDR
jgi:hypothetical protein